MLFCKVFVPLRVSPSLLRGGDSTGVFPGRIWACGAGASASSGQIVFEPQEPFRGSPGYRIIQISGQNLSNDGQLAHISCSFLVSALDVSIWENKAKDCTKGTSITATLDIFSTGENTN